MEFQTTENGVYSNGTHGAIEGASTPATKMVQQGKMDYLGNVISAKSVAMEEHKISALLSYPQPTTTKGLRGFLCLTSYYKRFIKGYGTIAKPLTDVLKLNKSNGILQLLLLLSNASKLSPMPLY